MVEGEYKATGNVVSAAKPDIMLAAGATAELERHVSFSL